MLELPAVESKHAIDDFEKPQMPMNFGSYVYIFSVLVHASQKSLVEKRWEGLVRRQGILFRLHVTFLLYIEVMFYRIERHYESEH